MLSWDLTITCGDQRREHIIDVPNMLIAVQSKSRAELANPTNLSVDWNRMVKTICKHCTIQVDLGSIELFASARYLYISVHGHFSRASWDGVQHLHTNTPTIYTQTQTIRTHIRCKFRLKSFNRPHLIGETDLSIRAFRLVVATYFIYWLLLWACESMHIIYI